MGKGANVIGVRALRARLSFYLRAVARGETITVGDRRRRPVARLVPAAESPDRDAIDRLAVLGIVQRGSGKPGNAVPVKPKPGGRLVSDIVIADRD